MDQNVDDRVNDNLFIDNRGKNVLEEVSQMNIKTLSIQTDKIN